MNHKPPDRPPQVEKVEAADLSASAGDGVKWAGEHDALLRRHEKDAFFSQLVALGYIPRQFRVTVRHVTSEVNTRQRYEQRRPGRPRTREKLLGLEVRIVTENRTWGYTRIKGAMANLGHKLGRGTIRRILQDHGIEPAPERGKGMSWSVFLKAHWKARAASDFFTVEVWSWSGLVTYCVLFVMELATRRVCIAGVTTHPDTQWMLQMARQLTDIVDGILLGKRYLILDRDTKYCQAFRDFVKREGIEVIRLPPRSPNLNAYAERRVRGVRDECLSRLIPTGRGTLRRALREYRAHFHHERNHQGVGNVLIVPRASSEHRVGRVIRRPRLGGLQLL